MRPHTFRVSADYQLNSKLPSFLHSHGRNYLNWLSYWSFIGKGFLLYWIYPANTNRERWLKSPARLLPSNQLPMWVWVQYFRIQPSGHQFICELLFLGILCNFFSWKFCHFFQAKMSLLVQATNYLADHQFLVAAYFWHRNATDRKGARDASRWICDLGLSTSLEYNWPGTNNNRRPLTLIERAGGFIFIR